MFLIYELIYRAAALTHVMASLGGADTEPVVGSLSVLARHLNAGFSSPAVAGVSLLLLGCEVLLISAFLPPGFRWRVPSR